MIKRILVASVALAAIGIAAPSSAHCDIEGGTFNEASATFGDITVYTSEVTGRGVCDGAVEDTTGGTLRISDANGVLCERDDFDPSFDPFFFGAGISHAGTSECQADVQWIVTLGGGTTPETVVNELPNEPVVASNGEMGGSAGVKRPTPAHIRAGGVTWPGGSLASGEDADAYQIRSVMADVD